MTAVETEWDPLPRQRSSVALVAGVSVCGDAALDRRLPRPGAEGRAETLRALCRFDETLTLYDADATRADALSPFSGPARELTADDALFVSCAGHGTT